MHLVAYMYRIDPIPHTFFISLDVHNTRTAATPQQYKDRQSISGLSQLCHLLPRSDVVCPDESIEH